MSRYTELTKATADVKSARTSLYKINEGVRLKEAIAERKLELFRKGQPIRWNERVHAQYLAELRATARASIREHEAKIARARTASALLDLGDKRAQREGRRDQFTVLQIEDGRFYELKDTHDEDARWRIEQLEEAKRARVTAELQVKQPWDSAAMIRAAALRQDAAFLRHARDEHWRRVMNPTNGNPGYATDELQHMVGGALADAELGLEDTDEVKRAREAAEELSQHWRYAEALAAAMSRGDERAKRAVHDFEMIALTREHGVDRAVEIQRQRDAEFEREVNKAVMKEAVEDFADVFADETPTETPPLAS